MFGFLKRGGKTKSKKTRPRTRQKRAAPKTRQPHAAQSDAPYDLIKKISDLQDQLSRHDSRIYGRLESHDNFLQSQHHEPMKKAAIEIMNKLYNQPAPVREEVFRLIKSDEEILSIIGEGKMSAGDVAEKMGFTREHISRRISELTKGGLLTRDGGVVLAYLI